MPRSGASFSPTPIGSDVSLEAGGNYVTIGLGSMRRIPDFLTRTPLQGRSGEFPGKSPRIGLLIAVREPIVCMYSYSWLNERPAPSRRCINGSGGREEVACWN